MCKQHTPKNCCAHLASADDVRKRINSSWIGESVALQISVAFLALCSFSSKYSDKLSAMKAWFTLYFCVLPSTNESLQTAVSVDRQLRTEDLCLGAGIPYSPHTASSRKRRNKAVLLQETLCVFQLFTALMRAEVSTVISSISGVVL